MYYIGSGIARAFPGGRDSPIRRAKMRKKMSEVLSLRKIGRDLRKNEESGTLAHPDCEGGYGPDQLLPH